MKATDDYRNQTIVAALKCRIDKLADDIRDEAQELVEKADDLIKIRNVLGRIGEKVREINECEAILKEMAKP